jgi:hypothetical protein
MTLTESSSCHRFNTRQTATPTPRTSFSLSPTRYPAPPRTVPSRHAPSANRNTLPFRNSPTNHALRADSHPNGRPGDSRTPNKYPSFPSPHQLRTHARNRPLPHANQSHLQTPRSRPSTASLPHPLFLATLPPGIPAPAAFPRNPSPFLNRARQPRPCSRPVVLPMIRPLTQLRRALPQLLRHLAHDTIPQNAASHAAHQWISPSHFLRRRPRRGLPSESLVRAAHF